MSDLSPRAASTVAQVDSADFTALLDRYVDVVLRVGVNIQPGQPLVITSDPMPAFRAVTMRLAERAYALGAGDVVVLWRDAELARLRGLYASEAALRRTPTWRAEEYAALDREGAAYLHLNAPDAGSLSDVDPARLALEHQAMAGILASHWDAQMADRHVWCVISVATPTWARLVYPDLAPGDALATLWDVIFTATRAHVPDPVVAWNEHVARLASIQSYLNAQRLTRLRYSGTDADLVVRLPERHHWLGATSVTPQGIVFVPNMPTEEVFTLPLRSGVDGTVRSTLPFEFGGQTIEHMTLTFRDGRIISYAAESGGEALRALIETDEGSHYLGEVALAPLTSPCNVGRPLHDGLFDENASCHLAIGDAYPTNLQGGQTMSRQELDAAGANSSSQHVDFMIGSPDLRVEGETASGTRISLIEGGEWAAGLLAAAATAR